MDISPEILLQRRGEVKADMLPDHSKKNNPIDKIGCLAPMNGGKAPRRP
jgi:hypothetical protein